MREIFFVFFADINARIHNASEKPCSLIVEALGVLHAYLGLTDSSEESG